MFLFLIFCFVFCFFCGCTYKEEYTESYTGNPEAGLKVLVHDQKDPPLMDYLGVAVPPGYHTFLGVQKNDVSFYGLAELGWCALIRFIWDNNK